MLPTESQEAQVFVAWLRVRGLRFHHSPNETGHSLEARRRAVRVKREGTSPGFPDYIVFIRPGQSIDGTGYIIFVELKRRQGGRVTPAQKEWIDSINGISSNVVAVVCRGAVDAIAAVDRYIHYYASRDQVF